jgi:hypothetical protein
LADAIMTYILFNTTISDIYYFNTSISGIININNVNNIIYSRNIITNNNYQLYLNNFNVARYNLSASFIPNPPNQNIYSQSSSTISQLTIAPNFYYTISNVITNYNINETYISPNPIKFVSFIIVNNNSND